jgi:hypothetical protein
LLNVAGAEWLFQMAEGEKKIGTMCAGKGRIARDKRTIQAMITLYCRGNHQTTMGLCKECTVLLEYARLRLDKCPFGENKPTCARCPIHCYKPDMLEKIRRVMRYSGPRMLLIHPALAIGHLWDGFKKRR